MLMFYVDDVTSYMALQVATHLLTIFYFMPLCVMHIAQFIFWNLMLIQDLVKFVNNFQNCTIWPKLLNGSKNNLQMPQLGQNKFLFIVHPFIQTTICQTHFSFAHI